MSARTFAHHRQSGFTLIELLVVVVIIGILATITIPKFTASRDRALRAAVVADLRALSSAQELYFSNHHTYGPNLADVTETSSEDVVIAINEATVGGWAATATHAGTNAGLCGIYYGDAAATGGDPAASPGIVQCSF